jgi:hypothetical protein
VVWGCRTVAEEALSPDLDQRIVKVLETAIAKGVISSYHDLHIEEEIGRLQNLLSGSYSRMHCSRLWELGELYGELEAIADAAGVKLWR